MYFGDAAGESVIVCLHAQPEPQDFRIGKRYIGTLTLDWSYGIESSLAEHRMAPSTGPFSTQVDASTHMPVDGASVPMSNNLWRQDGTWEYLQPPHESGSNNPRFPDLVYADEVTEDFYGKGCRGEIWLNWAEGLKRDIKDQQNFSVVPTNDLQLFPSFHNKDATIKEGRAITAEEFSSGQKVCLVTKAFASKNLLDVGEKIKLSLVYSMYGTYPIMDGLYTFGGMCSPLNSKGEMFEPFWDCEYEIVGFYDIPFDKDFQYLWTSNHELKGDTIIIPVKSVGASDENNIAYYAPMKIGSTSFILPNGSIEKFDRKLREAVPEAENLKITYDDSGYTEIMNSLNSAKLSGIMLLLIALFAALAILVLLMYFFVVKEKKRTAIERSLGMTKKQCTLSIVSGIVIITLTASILGSAGGAALIEEMDVTRQGSEEPFADYNLEYSVWVRANETVDVELDVSTPWPIYAAIPCSFTLTAFVLAVLMVNRNIQIEPIYLLSTRAE